MRDYPRDVIEFERTFAKQEDCLEYVLKVRWPKGVSCPHCASDKLWRMGAILECHACTRQTRITAGTLFEGSHLPLLKWFWAIWLMVTQKNGASALGLKRELAVSYKTAWGLLHKIRSAMARPERTALSGCIEVDETYVGGVEEGAHGRQTGDKKLLVIAAQERGQGIGRIRIGVVDDASARNLLAFIKANIERSSVVRTDAWKGYASLGTEGYPHKISVMKTEGPQTLPRVHLVASLLKRWLLGTHQGPVSAVHLEACLNEFVFRFNRRTSHSRGLLFYRLMQEVVRHAPVPFAKITKHSHDFIRHKA